MTISPIPPVAAVPPARVVKREPVQAFFSEFYEQYSKRRALPEKVRKRA
jgi:hypothetical protein